jgi:hypothetical protein
VVARPHDCPRGAGFGSRRCARTCVTCSCQKSCAGGGGLRTISHRRLSSAVDCLVLWSGGSSAPLCHHPLPQRTLRRERRAGFLVRAEEPFPGLHDFFHIFLISYRHSSRLDICSALTHLHRDPTLITTRVYKSMCVYGSPTLSWTHWA